MSKFNKYYEVRSKFRIHFETLSLDDAQAFVKEYFEASSSGEILEIIEVDRG
jgi:hypothetical protein